MKILEPPISKVREHHTMTEVAEVAHHEYDDALAGRENILRREHKLPIAADPAADQREGGRENPRASDLRPYSACLPRALAETSAPRSLGSEHH